MENDAKPETASLVFLHGFLSSARGSKSRFLAEKLAATPDADFHAIELNPTPRDFEYMTVTGQINRLRQYVLDQPDWQLFGWTGSP
jgi:predicted esterase YcpF (UPF0227 family)